MSLKYLTLRLEQVVPNQNWQTRSKLNENNVERLMQRMQDGVTLPPILVYQVGDRYEIVDGFHRHEAAKRLGHTWINAELFEGDAHTALAEGVTRNMSHGLQLMKEDMKKAARMLYRPPSRKNAKDGFGPGRIAKLLGVSKSVVDSWLGIYDYGKRNANFLKKSNAAVKLVETVGEEGLREAILDRFGVDALRETYNPVVRWKVSDRTPGSPGTPMLMISDFHYGEHVDPAQVFNSNRFDREIAKRRLRHTFETSVTLLQKHMAHPKYPGIVLVLGGDIINGSLHEDSLATDEVPPLVQALEVSKLLADGVAFLAENFPQVTIYGVSGNHGRITRKPWAKFYAQQNLDWLTYQMAKDHTARLKNVEWNVPPVRDLTFTVEGRRFRLTHGDQFRGGDGVIGALGPVIRGDMKKRVAASLMPGQPEQYDTLLVGHFHQLVMLPRVIVNGSIKGYDEFALQMNLAWEPPQQALWTVHKKYGLNWLMPVICDEAFTAHEIEKKVA